MRSTTAAELNLLNATDRNHHLRVRVENADGTLKDLTNLQGVDWVDSARWGASIDQPVPEATIRLRRDTQGLTDSLAPLATGSRLNVDDAGSYAALVDPGRRVTIEAATTDVGATPASGDWKFLFDGEIDRVNWGKQSIDLVARDLIMATLNDRWIENETVYGTDDGVSIQRVMQTILEDWTDGIGPLRVIDEPGFNVTTYEQQKMSVLQALTTLVQLIGFDIKSRWNGTSSFELQLFQPDRSPTTTDHTFGQSDVIDYKVLDVDRAPIRNVVSVRFTATGGERQGVETTASTSIARFGRRWMQIEESSDSPINTSGEATTFSQAAVDDLSAPQADQQIETHFFWPIELQDNLKFTAGDGTHYSTDQELGVYGFEHELSNDGRERTTIRTRGKPAGQYLAWHKNHRTRRDRPITEKQNDLRLLNFRRQVDTTNGQVTFRWDWGGDVIQAWIHDETAAQPEVEDVFASFSEKPPDTVVDRDTDSAQYVAQFPATGEVRILQFEPRSETLQAGPVVRAIIEPQPFTEVGDIPDGAIVSNKLIESAQTFGSDIVFSATDWDTVEWTAGDVETADGTTYSLNGNNTGDLADDNLRYIYLDTDTSTTELQITTTLADTQGDNRFLLAVAKRGPSSNQDAFFVPAVGELGLTSDHLGVLSVSTSVLQANAVTAAKINVATLSAISADIGTVTAGTVEANVIIAATSFTASSVTLEGEVTFEADTGTKVATLGAVTNQGTLELYDGGSFAGEVRAVGADGLLVTSPNGTVLIGESGASASKLQFFSLTPGDGVAQQTLTATASNAEIVAALTAYNLTATA